MMWFTRVSDGFGLVVVERKVRSCHVGQVGGDVTAGDVHLAVLHVFGVDKLDLVDHVQFIEQDGADKTVEIAAGD